DASPVSAGSAIGFTIGVANAGPGTAAGVKLSDVLPTTSGLGWSIVAADTSAGWATTCAIANGSLTCGGATGVSLAVSGTLSVHITSGTAAASCAEIPNIASASLSNGTAPANANASVTVQ